MKLKLLSTLLAAAGIGMSGQASAVIVGGINFGAIGASSHLETTTVAETVVNAVGQTLFGYGQVNTVNGASGYCANDPNCRLFFSFTYEVQTFSPTQVSFNNGELTVFYDPGTGGGSTGATRNLLNFTSPANLAYINGLTPWVSLTGHDGLQVPCAAPTELCAFGLLTGSIVSFLGGGLLDVDASGPGLADVEAYLNGNSESDGLGGFADISVTTSGNSSNPAPQDTCTKGAPKAGEWCIQGSADLRGSVLQVPEPASLGLLGLGLLALGLRGRRKEALA